MFVVLGDLLLVTISVRADHLPVVVLSVDGISDVKNVETLAVLGVCGISTVVSVTLFKIAICVVDFFTFVVLDGICEDIGVCGTDKGDVVSNAD